MKIFSKIFQKRKTSNFSSENNIDNSLKEEIFRLNAIIDNVPASMYWKDKDGVYLGQNLYAKRKMQSVEFSETMIGKTDYDLFPKEAADQYRKNDLEVMNDRAELSIEETVKLPSGKTLTQLSTKKPLVNALDQVVGVIGITVDITSQKESEVLKHERETIKQQLETVKTLSATIAHELRTPLAAIVAASEGAKNYFPALIDTYKLAGEANLPIKNIKPSQFKLLSSIFDGIIDEVNQSNTIINMLLLNVEQLTSQSKDFQRCSISHCIDEALNHYSFQPDERNLIRWENEKDFYFMGKELLTIHVLFNLLKNSIYYVKTAGKGDIHIWLEAGYPFNKLHFRDTGKGISVDILPKIFDLFFTKTYHGAGIGLAFCKTVMLNYGGQIECQSVEGEFTEFILSFPTLKAE